MTEWKTIDTAPKDTSLFLVCDNKKNYGYNLAFYDYDNHYKLIHNSMHLISINDYTHWMPLPKQPEKEHYCRSSCGDWLCKTNKNTGKGLVLADYRGVLEEVVACPFCGEKADD